MHLKDIALVIRRQKYRLDDIAKPLPDGATKEVVEVARMKLHDSETALNHEADVLERHAEAEEDE